MTPEQMLQKLNEFYEREEQLIKQIDRLMGEYHQLQEDKEMIQTMYMYAANKNERRRTY